MIDARDIPHVLHVVGDVGDGRLGTRVPFAERRERRVDGLFAGALCYRAPRS